MTAATKLIPKTETEAHRAYAYADVCHGGLSGLQLLPWRHGSFEERPHVTFK